MIVCASRIENLCSLQRTVGQVCNLRPIFNRPIGAQTTPRSLVAAEEYRAIRESRAMLCLLSFISISARHSSRRVTRIQLFLGVVMIVRRVRAVNTAVDSENRIHDDRIAAAYGFRGGLVPGVTVYGYMTLPVLDHFGEEWLDRGAMSVRFKAPGYDGEEVAIEAHATHDGPLDLSLPGRPA